jgi:pimeloyl-ACP methyl ester carboxylesterase
VLGTDSGTPISYALAADRPDNVERLAVAEAVRHSLTAPDREQPGHDRLWHIPFNRLKNLNEHLVKGREDIYFGVKRQGLPGDVIKYYVDMLRSDPNALRGSFGQYRAFDTTIAQNQQRKNHRLTLWVPRPGPDGALLGHGARDGQAMIATLRHRLIRVPARLVRHAGTLTLRLPPGHHLLDEILARIRALPATS